MTKDTREAFEKWAYDGMRAGQTNGLARKESGEYLWSGTSFAFDVWKAATQAASEEIESLRADLAAIGGAIHYPDCWDTAAYPDLFSAINEMGCNPDDCTRLTSEKKE